MYSLLMRYATPFITGLFIISLVSGAALFFHLGQNYFREMHEWLSMVLIVPFVLHLTRNWRPFLAYFRRLPMALALVISIAAGVFYAWAGAQGGPGGNPAMALASVMQANTLTAVAPLFGHTAESMTTALASKGYKVEGPDKTLGAIAAASGKDRFDIIRDLVAAKK